MKKNNNRELIPLFSIPLYQTIIPSIPKSIKNYITSVPYKRLLQVNNGWMTQDTYLLENIECEGLKKTILNELDYFVREMLFVNKNLNFIMTNSWGVKHDHGDWGQMHAHSNSIISGVFYLQTNSNSGNIIFHRDTNYTNLFPNALDIDCESYNNMNSKIWSIEPKNNMLLLFPSHLNHSILQNLSEEQRFVVAFNFFVKGNLGANEWMLKL